MNKWKVIGLSQSGKPFTLKINAEKWIDAIRKTGKNASLITSCKLIEESPESNRQKAMKLYVEAKPCDPTTTL